MKKFLMFIIISTLFVISACTFTKSKTLEEFYTEAKIEQVNKVVIWDERNNNSKVITEPNEVNDFVSLIKDVEFTPQENKEDHVKSNYKIILFDFDNETEFGFSLNKIGDTYYDANKNIFRIVDQYYLHLEVDEK